MYTDSWDALRSLKEKSDNSDIGHKTALGLRAVFILLGVPIRQRPGVQLGDATELIPSLSSVGPEFLSLF